MFIMERCVNMGNLDVKNGNTTSIGVSQPIGVSQAIGVSKEIRSAQSIRENQTIEEAFANATPRPGDESPSKVNLGVTQNMNIPSQQLVMNNYSTPPKKKKNMIVAMLLSFFFGPLGMIYTNVIHALILIVLFFLTAGITGSIGVYLFWFVSLVWTYIDIKKFNEE